MNKNNLIWLDLEMTGLNPNFHFIIEIATIITDNNLSILAEGPVFAIHQSEEILLLMDKWNLNTHTNSGLLNRVKNSIYDVRTAEQETINFLRKWVSPNTSPICGNTINQDRRFLFKYMPDLESYFHYRCLDVSTLKELAHRWKPQILNGFRKINKHQALEDIRESISELSYYRNTFLKI